MFDFNTDDERAVSPVIGVILMVAITVILAAVIGAFVLNLGSNVESNVQAGANVQSDASENSITTSFSSRQDSATTLNVTFTGSGIVGSPGFDTVILNDPGSTVTITDSGASISGGGFYSGGSSTSTPTSAVTQPGQVTVTVVANNGDQSTQILSKQVDLS